MGVVIVDSTAVLVVGAGPAGLAVACGLLQHGVSVRVVDEAHGPATTSRANILHARGVEVLNRLGALGDLRDRAVSGTKMTIHLGGRPVATVRFGKVEGAQLSALLVSQAEIEAQLGRRLAELGGGVEWNAALVGATRDDAGVTASLGTGEAVHAGWMVGCDGAHSTTRKEADIGFPGAPVTDQWLLADVHADWDVDRTGSMGWYHRDGLFFAMPMREAAGSENLWRLMCDISLSEDERLDDQEILDRFRRLLPERTGLTDVRILDTSWTSVFRIHRRLADQYRSGRILLAGDAAHIHSPFGGQGMNTGIGDAENLAWKLALVVRGRAHDLLLDTYEAERRPLAEDVLRNTTANTRLMVSEGRLMRFLRDRVMTPLSNLPAVQRWATNSASQLWVSYRRGPLAGPGSRMGRRPRPGDRVPDVACRRSDGSATRLHAELGGHWVLLVPDAADEAPVTSVRKRLGEYVTVLHFEGRQDEVRLVRPDAHLAWRGRPDSGRLDRWLDDALQQGRAL
ncbi:MAG: NAD(P)-binding protein [Pseudonocardiaceae bacterium]|nr:NAD(P)-binding protein [Pseudonocardiaceae bacterium]